MILHRYPEDALKSVTEAKQRGWVFPGEWLGADDSRKEAMEAEAAPISSREFKLLFFFFFFKEKILLCSPAVCLAWYSKYRSSWPQICGNPPASTPECWDDRYVHHHIWALPGIPNCWTQLPLRLLLPHVWRGANQGLYSLLSGSSSTPRGVWGGAVYVE